MENSDQPVRCGCGGEAMLLVDMNNYSIMCRKCGISTENYDTKTEAITAWNKAMGADKRSDLAITKGYWMVTYDGLHCSICNYKLDTTAVPDICPHCRAEMK